MFKQVELLLNQVPSPVTCFDRNRYYLVGLKRASSRGVRYRGPINSVLATLRSTDIAGVHTLWRALESFERPTPGVEHVGRYVFHYDHCEVRVAIDTFDGPVILDRDAHRWCDIYYKSNYWPDYPEYDSTVRPMINGNGRLSDSKLDYLRTHTRRQRKTTDLCFWSNVWTVDHPAHGPAAIEHQIRMFEELARLDCNADLLAVVNDTVPQNARREVIRRLDRAGIPWRSSWGSIDTRTLWEAMGRAQINLLRAGNHLCVSWKLIDMLAMGACIVSDNVFPAQWPQPLLPDAHYVSLDCGLGLHYQLPEADQYRRIPERIESLLNTPDRVAQLQRRAADYFDQVADPEIVALAITSDANRIAVGRMDQKSSTRPVLPSQATGVSQPKLG